MSAIATVGALIGLLVAICAFFGIRTRLDVIAYRFMPRECHPVWRPLALRLIRAGQPVEDVIDSHRPVHVHRWDHRYTLLAYSDYGDFTGLAILARDDKLIMARASSCTWRHTFFATLPESEIQAVYKSFWEWFEKNGGKIRSQQAVVVDVAKSPPE